MTMQENTDVQVKRAPRRKKFIVAGAVLLLALGYLAYVNFSASATYYLTPSELQALGPEAFEQTVRVDGTVAPGNIEWSGKSLVLKFTITDEGASFPVTYRGVVPDTFKAGGEVIVEGTYNADGTFEATRLWARCPSRYERKA
jgi:cytochrome c-type biogenesis protein CcmE